MPQPERQYHEELWNTVPEQHGELVIGVGLVFTDFEGGYKEAALLLHWMSSESACESVVGYQ